MINKSLVVQSSITVLQGWSKPYWRCNVKEKGLHGLSVKVSTKQIYKSTGTRSSGSTSYSPCSHQNKCTSGLFLTWRKWSTGRMSSLMVWRLQGRRNCLCCGTWCKGFPNPPRQISPRRRWIWMEESILSSTTIYEKSTRSIKSRQFLSDFLCQLCWYFSNRQTFSSVDSTYISTILNVRTDLKQYLKIDKL